MIVATSAWIIDQVLLCSHCAGPRIPGLHSDYNEMESPGLIVRLPISKFECSGCGETVTRRESAS